jgi:hypothetical protein
MALTNFNFYIFSHACSIVLDTRAQCYHSFTYVIFFLLLYVSVDYALIRIYFLLETIERRNSREKLPS